MSLSTRKNKTRWPALLVLIILLGAVGVLYGETRKSDEVFQAIAKGNLNELKVLLDHGAEINVRNPAGATPLMMAIKAGRADMAELLIKRGALVNTKSLNGWTALMVAADAGRSDLVQLLLAKGADAKIKNDDGFTALAWAEKKGYIEVATLLSVGKLLSAASSGATVKSAPTAVSSLKDFAPAAESLGVGWTKSEQLVIDDLDRPPVLPDASPDSPVVRGMLAQAMQTLKPLGVKGVGSYQYNKRAANGDVALTASIFVFADQNACRADWDKRFPSDIKYEIPEFKGAGEEGFKISGPESDFAFIYFRRGKIMVSIKTAEDHPALDELAIAIDKKVRR